MRLYVLGVRSDLISLADFYELLPEVLPPNRREPF
jgi:hypothetical protein